jgi:hypothetical protein
MSKQSGIGSYLFIGSTDISGDVGAVSQIEISRETFGVTSITSAAEERIVGRRDGAMAFKAFWNTSAGQEHALLSAASRADQIASVFIGSTLGKPAASITAKQLNYAVAMGEDGSLGADVNLEANGFGLEWGEMLTTGKQSFATGTVAGTAIDLGDTSTLFGAAAYLHVFSVASGTATFAVQDSDDNLSFTNVTGLAFTAATGATSQRLQTAAGATIRQYVRIQGTGVHGAAVVACNFVRYTEAGPV